MDDHVTVEIALLARSGRRHYAVGMQGRSEAPDPQRLEGEEVGKAKGALRTRKRREEQQRKGRKREKRTQVVQNSMSLRGSRDGPQCSIDDEMGDGRRKKERTVEGLGGRRWDQRTKEWNTTIWEVLPVQGQKGLAWARVHRLRYRAVNPTGGPGKNRGK